MDVVRLARYLVNNRRNASWWRSVRDTALAVEALAEFLVASKELEARLQLDVLIDGKVRKTVNITPEALFTFDDRLQLSGDEVAAGKHTIQLRKRGTGALYYSAYLTNFTREDPIAAAGLELRVSRRIFRLIPEPHSDLVEGSRGQAVRQRELKYRREPIVNLAEMPAGQLVEIELIIESKNDYDHVVLTDPKAAGVEPIDQTSGYNGNALGAYMEVRDDRVVLYASEIARGRHSVSYRARTERPGRYSAMPASAEGMYAPELRANSDELKVVIEGEHEKNAG